MTVIAGAQVLRVMSFRLAQNDISAVKYQRLDLNSKPCALIKVGLGVQGAKFPGTEVVGGVKFDTGEYWVYVVDGTKKLKVMHNDYTPLYIDFSNYPEQRLEGGRTYVMLLDGAKSDGGNGSSSQQQQSNFLIMSVTPPNASVTIDDVRETLNTDGTLKKLVSNGIHRYSIDAGSAYSPVNGTIEMKGERINLPITLKSVKASLSVNTTTSGSKIYINEDYKGTDSWQGELTPGTYLVEARKDGFRSATKTVTLAKQQTESITLPALQQIFGSMMVDYEPVDADVYLDNTLIGKTPNVFTSIAAGKHNIKISKAGYADYTGSVTIQENQQASVSGSLSKSSSESNTSSFVNNNSLSGSVVPITVNGVTFNMIKVDGGTFTMGATSEQDNPYGDEKPTHPVTLSSYYIGETEVTQALWKAVMGNNPSYFKGNNLPVEMVSWEDCQIFIGKLNSLSGKRFRLPTEAEWEFAARGGNKSNHTQYSGSSNIDDVAWFYGNSGGKTHSVKTKKANELGIYDMSGNVWEWCNDYYNIYSKYYKMNPTGTSRGNSRVRRGGSCGINAWYCRTSYRASNSSGDRSGYLGFRLVLSE